MARKKRSPPVPTPSNGSNGFANGVTYATAMAQQRTSPGVLLFTDKLKLLYLNAEAMEFNRRLSDAGSVRGLLPPTMMSFCEEVRDHLRRNPDTKDWERFQLTRVVMGQPKPVLLRGIGIPASRSLLILMENFSEHQRADVCVEARYGLTERERAVLTCLTLGMTNKEIATHVSLSEHTVKDHLKRIMRKMQVHTRAGISARAALFKAGTNQEEHPAALKGVEKQEPQAVG